MLTAEELVKLIKAHNKLSQIKIPAKAKNDVNALMKLVEGKGYKVNHSKKRLEPKPTRGKIIDLKKAEEVLPKPKTELQKQKAQERKEMKAQEEKKKLRQAKKEAVEKAMKGRKKSEPKKPVPKKPVPKKSVSIGTQTEEPKKEEPKKEEPKKKGRPKGAKTVLNFSKLKAKDINELFNRLNIIGPYDRVFNQEDFTIPQLRKWLKWFMSTEDIKPFPETISKKEEKDKKTGRYAFYTFNWYTYNPKDKNERYYERDLDTPEKKKKYNQRLRELEKQGIYMTNTYDDLYFNPKNKNLTKKGLLKIIEKFMEEQKNK